MKFTSLMRQLAALALTAVFLTTAALSGFAVYAMPIQAAYPQESIYDGILTILDYMDHTGRKIMINGGDCFVKKYLTAEKTVASQGVNTKNVLLRKNFEKIT